MKKFLPLLPLLLLAACRHPAALRHPALELRRGFGAPAAPAIAINPYISNILAISLLENRTGVRKAAAHIRWYFDRLNYPDSHGLTGTIYDYSLDQDGLEHSSAGYDSADAYAATFLILLEKYYTVSGDAALIREHWGKVKDVAFIIPYLQDKDGLVKAKPGSDAKYLMDNCECYGGLLAYQRLAEALGFGREAYLDSAATAIKKAVAELLYDGGNDSYYWGLSGGIKSGHTPDTIYPDELAQIFPALYGLTEDYGPIKRFLERRGDALDRLPLEQRLIVEMARTRAGLQRRP